MTDVNLKIDGLQNLLRALKANPPIARVGILSSTTAREGGDLNNATIGATHEFGTSTIPQRSFLRRPISEHLAIRMEDSGAFTEAAVKAVVAQKSLLPWTEKMAIQAVAIVNEAFDTQGFGQWSPLKPETMEKKKIKQILTETQQLRNSITYEVEA